MSTGFGDTELTADWVRVVFRGGQRQRPDQENVKRVKLLRSSAVKESGYFGW